jgi:hypothetical protein
MGFEPTTFRSTGDRSRPTELHPQKWQIFSFQGSEETLGLAVIEWALPYFFRYYSCNTKYYKLSRGYYKFFEFCLKALGSKDFRSSQ